MREVLISIQPKWCELIASGKKTVEVRKTCPKIEMPFKCYIYQTVDGRTNTVDILENNLGKVIGEFVCDNIYPIRYERDGFYVADFIDCETSCLKPRDFIAYGKGKQLYGWRISNLVIYDKPKELEAFTTFCDANKKRCANCKHYLFDNDDFNGYRRWCDVCHRKPLTRPPQSWGYVEGRKDR